jgi:hypothetical protein
MNEIIQVDPAGERFHVGLQKDAIDAEIQILTQQLRTPDERARRERLQLSADVLSVALRLTPAGVALHAEPGARVEPVGDRKGEAWLLPNDGVEYR